LVIQQMSFSEGIYELWSRQLCLRMVPGSREAFAKTLQK
jgi:hypothetical protein